jgi:phasin family protein
MPREAFHPLTETFSRLSMYLFNQSVTPAARTHVEAQVSFINDMSKTAFRSFQQFCDLNIQLAQTLLEESTRASQQMLTADRQTEVIGAAASRAQPTAEKMRAYQQHLSRIAADSQVELARVTEEHVSETSRTARALAEEVQRTATEETERNRSSQQEAMRAYRDPFADSMRQQQGRDARGGASMQSDSQGSSSMQGGAGAQHAASSTQQGASSAASGPKPTGTASRKET